MGIIDRIKDAVSPDDPDETTPAHPEASGPAAASGDTGRPAATPSTSSSGGQASEAGSGFSEAQTSGGGADAVPDTPDGVPENYT